MEDIIKEKNKIAYFEVIIMHLIYSLNIRELLNDYAESDFKDFLESLNFLQVLNMILTKFSKSGMTKIAEYNLYFILDFLKEKRNFESEDSKNNYLDIHNYFIKRVIYLSNNCIVDNLDYNNYIRYGYYYDFKNTSFDDNDYEMFFEYDFILLANLLSSDKDFIKEALEPYLLIGSIRYLLSNYDHLLEDKKICNRLRILLKDDLNNRMNISTRLQHFILTKKILRR